MSASIFKKGHDGSFTMPRIMIGFIGLVMLGACATTSVVTPAVRSDLAPTGKLRAAINLENTLLAVKDPSSGAVRGVAADLAHELGRRIRVPVEIVIFETSSRIAEAVKKDAWDIAFIAADPTRSAGIGFSPAYVEIEATYLVPAGRRFTRSRTSIKRASALLWPPTRHMICI
jgi:polar amino acid transport system substrate-binding protein